MSSRSGVGRAAAVLMSALFAITLGISGTARAATFTVVVGQTNGGTTNGVDQFNPASVSLTAGDAVTWNSAPDGRQHNVTSYAETTPGTPDWESPTLRSSGTPTFSRAFAASGTYTYYCSLHANRSDSSTANIDASIAAGRMVGKIIAAAAAVDTTGPSASTLGVAPNPTGGAASATLTATITDSGTPNSNIAAAELSIGAAAAAAGAGTAMTATDGAFNASAEAVTGTVNVSSYAAGTTITLWVRGRDAAGNWGGAASTTLSVTATPAGSVAATVTIAGGGLTNTTPGSIPFGAVSLTGADALLNASVGAFRATDARGTGAGWNITVTSTDFTSTTGGIAVANFKIRLPQASILTISGNTAPVSAVTSYQPLGTTALKICSAGAGQGLGTYDYTPDFQLAVPAQTLAGTYQAVVTVSINSGP